ncbi:MAG: NAD(P)H-dependent flavin oxidoreductase [Brevibacterium aurantiacum]|uniref:Dioxygenases related to 2-nitropropane dioxygenase n=1 Tax=Brevibacterium aurantiacum TaxID=273384 RepID=A0A1D7W1Z7_BREAU|nr:nitronate monooxygenase family protein [Brevibacterium aurantiacum]MDN5606807.1 nitronate monooxygenase family protein [Brevibacterium sp.]AOP52982.1 Dioxygenases related to 2-nitropropane dioxygenase [Brevibacterium aurantiacum]AZL12433.1 nitronate monooxygenase [Brevibacterium aurantiacum]RCS91737.1 nitronate monooxygenase [Brevibacterium aurantiacum]RCS94973.1 nitronate monooxygenase [Brevibacterium aurantiacum]
MNSFANLLPQLRLPVFGSPMFIASGPELVKAQCQAGIIGSFPTLNARPAAMLTDWLDEITESNAAFTAANPDRPAAPFAVNLIVHRSNNRLEEDLAEVVRHQVPIVVTSLGAREEVNEAVHSYGGIVLHDVINNKFAHKAVEKGADGVIAVASGAGGHAGALSPFALVQEIRTWFDGPLLLSGAIAHGRSVLAALAAGADCAYVGSAFLSTTEANVVDDYKQMIVDSAAEDVVYSNYFTGVKGNYLRGSITASGLDPDNLPEADPTKMDFGTKDGSDSKAWKDIWGSGQGIGVLREKSSTAELVDSLATQFEAAKKELDARLNTAVRVG